MMPIGQQLRSGREDKGVSRVDVSQETKIAVHHLAALEYSDFKELPDMVHVKGYVRAYAEYLGLEPTAVLEQFLDEYEAQRPTHGEDPRDEVVRKMSKIYGGSRRHGTKRLPPVLLVAALVLIVALVWVGWGRFGSDEPSAAVTSAPAVAKPTSAVIEEANRQPDQEVAQTPQQFVVIREPEPETPPPAPTPVVAAEPTPPAPTPVLAAEPTPPAPTPTPAPASATRLTIRQYGVGTGVENRQLSGESDRFAVGTKVTFFTRVEGGRTGDTIRHVWRLEGAEIASIPLRVGSANWRTYSVKTMHAGSAGDWTVEAVNAKGDVLARSEFHCGP